VNIIGRHLCCFAVTTTLEVTTTITATEPSTHPRLRSGADTKPYWLEMSKYSISPYYLVIGHPIALRAVREVDAKQPICAWQRCN